MLVLSDDAEYVGLNWRKGDLDRAADAEYESYVSRRMMDDTDHETWQTWYQPDAEFVTL